MFGPEDVAEFATRVLARDNSAALTFIREQRNRGAELDTLYVDLMAPAARHLGAMWVQDLCDFTQVTIGLGRLHQVLHELRNVFPLEHEGRPSDRRLLLMPAPGDQHTFGIAMVADLFRRGGWYVRSGPKTSQHDLIDTVRAEWYSVVGISIGSELRLEFRIERDPLDTARFAQSVRRDHGRWTVAKRAPRHRRDVGRGCDRGRWTSGRGAGAKPARAPYPVSLTERGRRTNGEGRRGELEAEGS